MIQDHPRQPLAWLLIVDEPTTAPRWGGLQSKAFTAGRVMLALPGVTLLPGEPAGQAIGGRDAHACAQQLRDWLQAQGIAVTLDHAAATQLYRVLDQSGRWQRDALRRLHADPIAGTVLLADVWREGQWVADPSADARYDRIAQAQARLTEQVSGAVEVMDER